MEIPIIVVLVAVVGSIILPRLPPFGQKVAAVLGALVFLFGAFYMIVIPGWQPNAQNLRPPWNVVVFAVVALLILTVTGAFIASH